MLHNISFRLRFLGIILFFVSLNLSAATHFAYSDNVKNAYAQICNLSFEKARNYLQNEEQQNPNNLLPLLCYNYIDFYTAVLSETTENLEKLNANAEKRLAILDKNASQNDPYYLYARGEIELQVALARLKLAQYNKGFWQMRRAYINLHDNAEKFPEFMPTYKSLGVMNALIETVPDSYQWGLKILGFSGNYAAGIKQLENFIAWSKQNKEVFLAEAIWARTYFYIYLDNDYALAQQMIRNEIPLHQSILADFLAADIAYRTGNADEALAILSHVSPQNEVQFPYLKLFLGSLYLYKQDLSQAKIYLQDYANSFEGKNYIKDAWQKIAWIYCLQNNETAYFGAMKNCKNIGAALVDTDKQAQRNAESEVFPNAILLKTQLLFDGGYLAEAKRTLQTFTLTNAAQEQIWEYYYRMGRIYDNMQDYNAAIKYYKQLTAMNNYETSYYFAPKACLQMGLIYEKQKNEAAALAAFKECLRYTHHVYKNSIDQQAKAGISRLMSN
ncbi:MAG: tetratricopeptide repeat protein [Chitinophagales bacterium]|nr:hypothetical protein [Bacteroidota bacterium]